MTPESRRTSTAPARTAPYRVLSGECVVVVVGNYLVCRWFNEVICTSACTSGFATHVETRSPPCVIPVVYGRIRPIQGSGPEFCPKTGHSTARPVAGSVRAKARLTSFEHARPLDLP